MAFVRSMWPVGLVVLLWGLAPVLRAAPEASADDAAAPAVSSTLLEIGPGADLPVYVSRDWSVPQPDIERAVIVQHGRARNASDYFETGLKAQAAAGEAGRHTLIVAPQFIDERDVRVHHVADSVLRFTPEGWEGGGAALAPKPLSSFEALDGVLARLADRRLFPALKDVVVAGHSGGGQVVQRYAILGRGDESLAGRGVAVSFVVANPSSYAYFSAERPWPDIAAHCPGVDDWKYGMQHLPAYAGGRSAADLEAHYVNRDVSVLLGALDVDPNHRVLDKSCMAEAQGPTRWARGHAYMARLRARDRGAPRHALYEIPGVGHDGDAMFKSACGLHVLFGVPGCIAQDETADLGQP